MALLNIGPEETRTGNNWFSRASNWLSFVPLGGVPSMFLGWIGAGIDGAKFLFKGRIGSAAAAVAVGGVASTVNGLTRDVITGGPIYWVNAATGVVTGRSLATHTRGLTEGLARTIGGRNILSSHVVGVGGINRGPGPNARMISQQRGQDPYAAYAAYRGGNADHVAALEAAQARSQLYRG